MLHSVSPPWPSRPREQSLFPRRVLEQAAPQRQLAQRMEGELWRYMSLGRSLHSLLLTTLVLLGIGVTPLNVSVLALN